MPPRICRGGAAGSPRPLSPRFSPSFSLAALLRLARNSHARFYAQQQRASTSSNMKPSIQQKQQKQKQLQQQTLQQGTEAVGTTAAPTSRTAPSPKSANSGTSTTRPSSSPGEDEFRKLWESDFVSSLKKTGEIHEIIRKQMMISAAEGHPSLQKPPLLDLIVSPKPTSLKNIGAILTNNTRNMISMNRLAKDFSFPGIMTKWTIHPQIFRCKSVSEKAWVAPFRRDMLDVYKRVNEAIATGNTKTLNLLTSYEYHERAFSLMAQLRSRLKNVTHSLTSRSRLHYTWELNSICSPLRILSLRFIPFNFDANEPRTGSRNVVQALARIETMQSLTLRNERGQAVSVQSDGSVVPVAEQAEGEGGKAQPRRVLEYLVFENRMFLTDGWYIRDQMYEGVQPRLKAPEEF